MDGMEARAVRPRPPQLNGRSAQTILDRLVALFDHGRVAKSGSRIGR